MTQAHSTAVFKTLPLLAELDDQELAALARVARQRTYPKGSFLFFQGDPGEACYFIVAGTVKVFLQGAQGRELILAWLRAGDFCGEMALFDDQPRSTSVQVTEAATVLILPKQAFLAQVKGSAPLLFKLLLALCRRLRGTDDKVADLALLDAYRRIAKALLLLGKAGGGSGEAGELLRFTRPTHQELADMVGTSRETVTRVVQALAHQGYLTLQGPDVAIRPAFLEHLGVL
jgi:CRP/FNR family cyclic AMP-dependent transcriptional regulator